MQNYLLHQTQPMNNENQDDITDFGNIFLGYSKQKSKKITIVDSPENQNNFNNFFNSHITQEQQRYQRDEQKNNSNLQQYQDGSIQFNKYMVSEVVSNQNFGQIPLETIYNQNFYPNNFSDNISQNNCQQSNKISPDFQSINFYNRDFEYKECVVAQQQPPQIDQIDMNLDQRFYKNEICPYLLPIKGYNLQQDGMIDEGWQILCKFENSHFEEPDELNHSQPQESNDLIDQDEGQIKKKQRRGNRKNKKKKQFDTQQQQEGEQQVIQQNQETDQITNNSFFNGQLDELDDAVSDEFKMDLTNFQERIQQSKFSLTQTIYGKKSKSIRIIEIEDYENQIQKLCQQFPNRKYSEIALALQLIVNFENCFEFLQTVKSKVEKPILREINQLMVSEQKAIESGNNNELNQSQYKINEFKKTNKIIIIEEQSLYQTAIKIIEQKNYKFDIKKCDKQTKEKKKADFEQNRNEVIAINNQKAKVVQQYQTCYINEQQCNQQLKQIKVEKQKLEKIGKNLFLDLMEIENGFCRIDFHGFFACEIENILDGVFDKIESYKLCNKQQQIKLQIIVGKGLHSKNNKPIIGPMTKQYIQQYLQLQVEIKEGKIDVIV
ncbi:unnamed protein product [Paramecium sonneborni]|uniref:Smr domain-containing protein n=1 Tax=Paramecium sonneborni TaxID=65129 RepID=A0A8S1NSZ9_9CILI|nr:unnamed protein product [Paramecium sonneborni]